MSLSENTAEGAPSQTIHASSILGATGNCGTALIDNLLRLKPHTEIRAYCRNRDKLLRSMPQVVGNDRVKIYEGNIHDVELMTKCIHGSSVVYHVVSTNDNVPNCSVGLDTAKTLIKALATLQKDATPIPKIAVLSSATLDDHLSRDLSPLFRALLLRSASNVYEDLRRTEAFLRANASLATTIFVKPAGLSVDIQRGHRLDLDHEESFVSYLDLAAAMIEAAEDVDGKYDGKNVGVVNANGGAKFPSGTPLCLAMGLLRHYFPFLHSFLPRTGPS